MGPSLPVRCHWWWPFRPVFPCVPSNSAAFHGTSNKHPTLLVYKRIQPTDQFSTAAPGMWRRCFCTWFSYSFAEEEESWYLVWASRWRIWNTLYQQKWPSVWGKILPELAPWLPLSAEHLEKWLEDMDSFPFLPSCLLYLVGGKPWCQSANNSSAKLCCLLQPPYSVQGRITLLAQCALCWYH